MRINIVDLPTTITTDYVNVIYCDNMGHILPTFEKSCQVLIDLFRVPLFTSIPNEFNSEQDVQHLIEVFVYLYNEKYKVKEHFEPIRLICLEMMTNYEEFKNILIANGFELTISYDKLQRTSINDDTKKYLIKLIKANSSLNYILGHIIWSELMITTNGKLINLQFLKRKEDTEHNIISLEKTNGS